MRPYIEALVKRGIDAHALRLPKGPAERAMAPLRDQVGEELGSAVIGGHSFGGGGAGRVAGPPPPARLLLPPRPPAPARGPRPAEARPLGDVPRPAGPPPRA